MTGSEENKTAEEMMAGAVPTYPREPREVAVTEGHPLWCTCIDCGDD